MASGLVAAGGFRKLVIQALNFSILFSQLLLGGELVLRELLSKRGKVLLKSGGLCLLLCQRGIVDLLVKRRGHNAGQVWCCNRCGLLLFLLVLPVPHYAACCSCAANDDGGQDGQLLAAGFQVFIQAYGHGRASPSSENTIQA